MTCWNCRGLKNSVLFLNALIEEDSKVIVASDHWLWAFELHRLQEVHPEFSGTGKADGRLVEDTNLSRGCGGVGILWHNSLVATPIAGIASDRYCGIRFKERERSDAWVTVVGPCGNLGMEAYQEQLEELERVVLESKVLGSVVVMGDFNAHLGILAGVRGQGGPNIQGVLVEGGMRRCGLYAASQSEGTSGPNYTYWSGEVQLTVDYILMDVGAGSMATPCIVHEMQDLNTSDHALADLCMPVIYGTHPFTEA